MLLVVINLKFLAFVFLYSGSIEYDLFGTCCFKIVSGGSMLVFVVKTFGHGVNILCLNTVCKRFYLLLSSGGFNLIKISISQTDFVILHTRTLYMSRPKNQSYAVVF